MCSDTSSVKDSLIRDWNDMSSYISSNGSGGVPLDPLTLVKGLLDSGAELTQAVELANKWMDVCKAGIPVSRRQQRLDDYYAECRAYAGKPGGCYMHAIRLCRRKRVWNDLGPDPTIADMLSRLLVEDYDEKVLSGLYLENNGMNYHVVRYDTGVSLRDSLTRYCVERGILMRFSPGVVGDHAVGLTEDTKLGRPTSSVSNTLSSVNAMAPSTAVGFYKNNQNVCDTFRLEGDGQTMLTRWPRDISPADCTVVMSIDRYTQAWFPTVEFQAGVLLVVCDAVPRNRAPALGTIRPNHFFLHHEPQADMWMISTMESYASGISTFGPVGVPRVFGAHGAMDATTLFRVMSCVSINDLIDGLRLHAVTSVELRHRRLATTLLPGVRFVGMGSETVLVVSQNTDGSDRSIPTNVPVSDPRSVHDCMVVIDATCLKLAMFKGWALENAETLIITGLNFRDRQTIVHYHGVFPLDTWLEFYSYTKGLGYMCLSDYVEAKDFDSAWWSHSNVVLGLTEYFGLGMITVLA